MLRSITSKRLFHFTPQSLMKVGDHLPTVNLYGNSPGEEVATQDIFKGKNLLVGVPGAFTSACSERHVPGFIQYAEKFRSKGIENIYVVAVNDPFVIGAWSKHLNVSKSGIRILSDPRAEFAKASESSFDGTSIFGSIRSSRYAAVVQDGVITHLFKEPDNTGITISEADKVYEAI